MKKRFNIPSFNIIDVEMADNILTQSSLGSLKGNYDGDGNGVTNVTGSSLARQTGATGSGVGMDLEILDF